MHSALAWQTLFMSRTAWTTAVLPTQSSHHCVHYHRCVPGRFFSHAQEETNIRNINQTLSSRVHGHANALIATDENMMLASPTTSRNIRQSQYSVAVPNIVRAHASKSSVILRQDKWLEGQQCLWQAKPSSMQQPKRQPLQLRASTVGGTKPAVEGNLSIQPIEPR
jgi:hypothetical protein